MKAYDDENQELGRLVKTHDPAAGQSSFAFDCSAVGAVECDVELFDSSGALIAIVRVGNGAAFTFADADADCPGGSDNEWSAALLLPAVQKLREARCAPISVLTLPDGSSVSDVKSYACAPVAPSVTTSGRRLRLTATGSYADGTAASIVITGVSFTPSGPRVAPDLDDDGDVDLADFGLFQTCFNGPNRAYASTGCVVADFDADHDVDLMDFGTLQACFNGPNRPPRCP